MFYGAILQWVLSNLCSQLLAPQSNVSNTCHISIAILMYTYEYTIIFILFKTISIRNTDNSLAFSMEPFVRGPTMGYGRF